MADSIERIADEVATYQAPPNGQYIQVHPRVMRDWESRLRALSPAGGDWVMVPARLTGPMAYAMVERLGHPDSSPQDCWTATIAASPQQEPGAVPSDDELPGMWERADMIGGATDAQTHCARCQAPDECDGKCPDGASGQTLAGAGDLDLALDIAISGQEHAITARHAAEERLANAEAILQRVLHDLIAGSCVEDETQKALCTFLDPITFPIVTATSAGTTGDDSEDAARYRWLRTCGVADDRAIHTRGYSELLSESALDAAIDARRAREVGND